ncbi:MAG TPA: ATP-binding protein [Alphaproteobacteria bacterium]
MLKRLLRIRSSAGSGPSGSRRAAPAGQRTSFFRSTTFRLSLIYLSLFSAALCVLLGVMYWTTVGSISRQIDATIDAEITGLAEQYRQGGIFGLIAAIERRSTAPIESRGLYLLAGPDYTRLAGNLSRWPDTQPDEEGWITFPLRFPEESGIGPNYGRARVFDLDGQIHLLVGHDIRERVHIATRVLISLAWGVVVTLVLSVAGGILTSRSVLRRIDGINVTSREIMAGDLSRRIPLSGKGDEFDQLAGNLNAVLDRNETLLAGMKQVTDNIAHDLRSPLGRLRGRLESLLHAPVDEARQRDVIERSIAEADDLLKTFNALLSIAQAESGAPRQHFEPIDLAALVRDLAELYEPVAEEKGFALDVRIDAGATIAGSRHLLFQALTNLIDNALKHAASGQRLTLGLRLEPRGAVVEVADDGPGIPEAVRDKVVERFYRLDSSRTTPGSGLGLSLVAAVAKLHGGTLELGDNRPGLVARLVLPSEAEPSPDSAPRARGPGAAAVG